MAELDKISVQRIALLHPELQDDATAILKECNEALSGRAKVRFTFTYRTPEEQNNLYALGRTKKNPDGVSKTRPLGYKVTNAPAWSSLHNFRLAVDIALVIDGKEASWNDVKDWDGDGVSDWMECVKIFKAHGWQWGGDWSSFVDKPHFQKTFGFTLKQLQAKLKIGDVIQGTDIVNVRTTASIKKPALVTTSGVNVRAGAGTEYNILKTIPANSQVLQLSENKDWLFVEFGKLQGWIKRDYLKAA